MDATTRRYVRTELARARARLEMANRVVLAHSSTPEQVKEHVDYCRSISREVAHWERRLAAITTSK